MTIFSRFLQLKTKKSHKIVSYYHIPNFKKPFPSVIPVQDQKDFVRANTKKGMGSVNDQNKHENLRQTG